MYGNGTGKLKAKPGRAGQSSEDGNLIYDLRNGRTIHFTDLSFGFRLRLWYLTEST